jgi:hypothetical protein
LGLPRTTKREMGWGHSVVVQFECYPVEIQSDYRAFSGGIAARELVYNEELTASSGRLTQR